MYRFGDPNETPGSSDEKIQDQLLDTLSGRNSVDEQQKDEAARAITRFMRMAAARLRCEAHKIAVEEYIENKIVVEKTGSDHENETNREENAVSSPFEAFQEDKLETDVQNAEKDDYENKEDRAARAITRFMRMAAARLKCEAHKIAVEEYIENKIVVEKTGSDDENETNKVEEKATTPLSDTLHGREFEKKTVKKAIDVQAVGELSSSLEVGREVAPRRHILDEGNHHWSREQSTEMNDDDQKERSREATECNVGTESVEKPLNKPELEVLDERLEKSTELSSEAAKKTIQNAGSEDQRNLEWKKRNDFKLASGASREHLFGVPMNPSHGCQAGDSSFADPSLSASVEEKATVQPLVKYVKVQKQASEGSVAITVTILPMGFKICKTLVVTKYLPGMAVMEKGEDKSEEETSTLSGTAENSKKEGWVLVAKDIFEALGSAMGVHPQSFHVYRSQQRVRFTDALFLNRDLYVDDSASACEPLWIDVQFPENVEIPDHLVTITPEEVLIRCVFVHPVPLDIPVPVVAEGKRRGLSHDEVIKQIYIQAESRNELPWATVALVHDGTGVDKPYLGGYNVKKDKSKIFLHASTQLFMKGLNYSTQVGRRSCAGVEQLSRRTQTWGISRSCQTRRECCVMTPCKELVVDHSHDFVVIARPYFYSHQLHALQVEKTIILQKFYRQWKARKIRRQLEMEDAEKQQRAEARQLAEEAAKLETDNREQRRRDDPRTKEDFDRLKQELMAWVNSENKKIVRNKGLSNEKKREALLALNHQELKMLQDLEDRRRIITLMEKDRRFAKMFQTMSAPKLWGEVEVRTPETERAAELRALYLSLTNTPHLSTRGRLDVLLHIKWTVKEFSQHSLTQELCQLIDREADLLHRGRRVASLTGLRGRIEKLFKRFIEDPEFNPGMVEYTRTAVGRAKAKKLYGTVYDENNHMTVDPALQNALRRRNNLSAKGSGNGGSTCGQNSGHNPGAVSGNRGVTTSADQQ